MKVRPAETGHVAEPERRVLDPELAGERARRGDEVTALLDTDEGDTPRPRRADDAELPCTRPDVEHAGDAEILEELRRASSDADGRPYLDDASRTFGGSRVSSSASVIVSTHGTDDSSIGEAPLMTVSSRNHHARDRARARRRVARGA